MVEGDMKLIDSDLHARIKAYLFQKIFEQTSTKENQKDSARDFIKHLKTNMPKDMSIDTSLVTKELQVADLARRVKNWETRSLDFEASLEEV